MNKDKEVVWDRLKNGIPAEEEETSWLLHQFEQARKTFNSWPKEKQEAMKAAIEATSIQNRKL